MPDPVQKHDYLGDGVHAQFDGQHIWLMVERCENPFGDPEKDPRAVVRIERVALEPEVFSALLRFAKECWPDGEPT
jgi:hypothetical protein